MKTIRVVDTNVILRYLLADHPEHFAQASEFMAGLKSGNQTAYIPESPVGWALPHTRQFKGKVQSKPSLPPFRKGGLGGISGMGKRSP